MLLRMAGTAQPDDLDARIAGALQLDGRASWSLIARQLGVSESAVLRRVSALHAARRLRVIGVVDVLRCGFGVPVLVRMRCRPGTANAVADVVAAHSETRYVAVLTGGADAAAEIVVPGYADLAHVVDGGFGGPDVTAVESAAVIRTFASNHDWDPGVLGGEAAAALRAGAPPRPFEEGHPDGPPEQLDATDLAVVAALGEDGRMSYTEIANRTGVSESTARRRVDSLVRRGCLRFRTLAEPELFGFGVEFMVWLSVRPGDLDEAARTLAAHRATRYLSATTGTFGLVAQVALRHHADLYRYLTEVIGTLPGVDRAETTLQLRTLKRAWAPTPAARMEDV